MKKFVKAVIFGVLAALIYIGMMFFISMPLQIMMRAGAMSHIEKSEKVPVAREILKSVGGNLNASDEEKALEKIKESGLEEMLNSFGDSMEESDAKKALDLVDEKFEDGNIKDLLSSIIGTKKRNGASVLKSYSSVAYYVLLIFQFVLSFMAEIAFLIFIKKVIQIFPDVGVYFSGLYVLAFAVMLVLPELLCFLSLFLKFPMLIVNLICVVSGGAFGAFVTVMASKILPDITEGERRMESMGEGE